MKFRYETSAPTAADAYNTAIVWFESKAKTEAGIIRAARKAMMDKRGIDTNPIARDIQFKSVCGLGTLDALLALKEDAPAEWSDMFDKFQKAC